MIVNVPIYRRTAYKDFKIFFTLLIINQAVSIDVWNSAVYDNDSRYVQCEQAGMPFSEGFRLVYYMAEKTRQIRGLCP